MPATAALPPGPRGPVPIREIRILRRDVVGFLKHMANNYGDLSCVRIGHLLIYIVSHPELVHETLVTRNESLQKSWIFGNAKDALGEGMLTSSGDFHRHQRKLIRPALHHERVHAYAQTMIRMADDIARDLPNETVVDMDAVMRSITLPVVADTLFGADLAAETGKIGTAITQLTEVFNRAKSPFGTLLNYVPILPLNRRVKESMKTIDDAIYRIISQRRESADEHDDLLSMLLAAQDAGGASMHDSMVRNEVLALMLAGHETTAITLTWAWYVLAQHPEIEAEFHKELEDVLGDRLPVPDDLKRFTFTRKVVAETIRYYPAFYLVLRSAAEPCTLGGYDVRPGTIIFVSVYNVHHDPRFYPDPERFDPHRWTPEMKEQLPRYAYCGFGGGSHACLGESFAWTEAMLVLAVLGQRWKARIAPGHTVGLNPLVNLRPRGGMPMILTRR
ncbi:MAG: cytochrome P450 [Candidatus Hydrogenedentota bacterium]